MVFSIELNIAIEQCSGKAQNYTSLRKATPFSNITILRPTILFSTFPVKEITSLMHDPTRRKKKDQYF